MGDDYTMRNASTCWADCQQVALHVLGATILQWTASATGPSQPKTACWMVGFLALDARIPILLREVECIPDLKEDHSCSTSITIQKGDSKHRE